MDNQIKVLHIVPEISPSTPPWLLNLFFCLKDRVRQQVTGWKTQRIDNVEVILFPNTVQRKYPPLFEKLKWRYIYWKFINHTEKTIQDISILHCHFSVTGYYSLKLRERLNIPLVVSFYGYDYESIIFQDRRWKNRYLKLFNKADLLIAEGSHGASILKKLGCEERKIQIAHLGVYTEKIPFKNRQKKTQSLRLVQIATFTEKKGHIYTALAFCKALKHAPNMNLTMIGGGSDQIKNEIIDIFKRNNAINKLEIIDRINYSAIYDFLGDFDVFIHPSCYSKTMDCEGGAPIVLLDAQATGMPVISTHHCDIPDEVIDRKSGILVHEKDTEALSEAILEFYNMGNDDYLVFSKNARDHIDVNYNLEKNISQLVNIYRDALTKKEVGKELS